MSNENNQVTVVDVKMPFLSMVIFLVKLSIAAIPAMLIIGFIMSVIGMIFGGLFHNIHY